MAAELSIAGIGHRLRNGAIHDLISLGGEGPIFASFLFGSTLA